MAGLVPAIHALFFGQDVDARHKAGHDGESLTAFALHLSPRAGRGKKRYPLARSTASIDTRDQGAERSRKAS
jgi:hypothetical protein